MCLTDHQSIQTIDIRLRVLIVHTNRHTNTYIHLRELLYAFEILYENTKTNEEIEEYVK